MRFPGFGDEWTQTTLRACSESLEYGMNTAATTFDGENKYIRITDIDEASSKYISNVPVSPEGDLEDKYLVKENDILFARTGASTGKSYLYNINDGKLYFAGFLIKVKVNYLNNANFIFNQTKTNHYQKWVTAMSMRSGQPGINSKEYASFKFWVPSKSEQDKIASFLSLVDERIETQSKIIKDYKLLKKGLKQRIYKQEMKFKDKNGNPFPEWEKRRLEKVLDYKQPTKYLVIDAEYNDAYKIPVLTAGKTFLLGYTNETEGVFEDNLPAIIFDDFTTAIQYVDFPFKAKSSAMKMLIPKNEKENIQFVFEAMGTIRFPLAEHKRYWISEYQYEKIPYPCREEQQKIASTLSTIDNRIILEAKLLEELKSLKRFFLLNLFI